jgi:hypothetical protein
MPRTGNPSGLHWNDGERANARAKGVMMTTIYSVMYPTQTPTGNTGTTNPASSTQQPTTASQLSRNISLS